ncbi:MAG TPA: hypothetical protein VI729_08155 [Anaerolineales bacterium]|nr:hypothetical protein [Anaerolineales bacterium]
MNILRKIVKETVLTPYRVLQGLVDAADTVETGKEKPEPPKEKKE